MNLDVCINQPYREAHATDCSRHGRLYLTSCFITVFCATECCWLYLQLDFFGLRLILVISLSAKQVFCTDRCSPEVVMVKTLLKIFCTCCCILVKRLYITGFVKVNILNLQYGTDPNLKCWLFHSLKAIKQNFEQPYIHFIKDATLTHLPKCVFLLSTVSYRLHFILNITTRITMYWTEAGINTLTSNHLFLHPFLSFFPLTDHLVQIWCQVVDILKR